MGTLDKKSVMQSHTRPKNPAEIKTSGRPKGMPGLPDHVEGTTRRKRSIHMPTRIMIVIKIMGMRVTLILLLSRVRKGMNEYHEEHHPCP